MNFASATHNSPFKPAALMEDLRLTPGSKYVDVVSGNASWQVYVAREQLVYVSYAAPLVLPQLQYSFQVLGLDRALAACKNAAQLSSKLKLDSSISGIEASDRLLTWLMSQGHLDARQAAQVVEGTTRAALESLLCARTGSYTQRQQALELRTGTALDIGEAVAAAEQRLQKWRAFLPAVRSPHQRPRLCRPEDSATCQLPENLKLSLGNLLKGYSLRQLALVIKQDELKVVQFLSPHIRNQSIQLDDPLPPYDTLPDIVPPVESGTRKAAEKVAVSAIQPVFQERRPAPPAIVTAKTPEETRKTAIADEKQYTIACVDDSPTVLTQIDRFLNASGHQFAVTAITHPVKAMVQIIRLRPDLILLDVGMPNINGYDLCRILRNNRSIAKTPIIMVTGNTAMVDRMQARVVGATDFLAKPFTQEDLVGMVSKHLNLADARQRIAARDQQLAARRVDAS